MEKIKLEKQEILVGSSRLSASTATISLNACAHSSPKMSSRLSLKTNWSLSLTSCAPRMTLQTRADVDQCATLIRSVSRPLWNARCRWYREMCVIRDCRPSR